MTKIVVFLFILNSMKKLCNISYIFLNYMDTFLETIHHILVVSMMRLLILLWLSFH